MDRLVHQFDRPWVLTFYRNRYSIKLTYIKYFRKDELLGGKTMLQQVMTAPGVIEFREVPVPEPGDHQVLVKIEKIGVCGSDIHVYHGKHPFTKYPVTQGHEVSGTVEKFGRQ